MKKLSKILKEELENSQYNRIIDFTYLKEDATDDKIFEICEIAKTKNFYSVCVRPQFVSLAKGFLKDSDVKVCTVISFPSGKGTLREKIFEASKALAEGADELDMVANYELLIEGVNDKGEDKNDKDEDKLEIVETEIRKVTEMCHGPNSAIIKIIIETDALNMEQIKSVCEMCIRSKVDFVKTSTGYYQPSQSLDEKLKKVKYIKSILPDYIDIKVSGGVRSLDDIQNAVSAGANRIGTSSSLDY